MNIFDIWNMFLNKLKMYRYYAFIIKKQLEREWFENCIHSTLQQIVCMNFLLYKTIMCLQLNYNHRLISYSMNIRFALFDNAIEFRNLNRNAQLLFDEKNFDCYSTSITFTKKNENNNFFCWQKFKIILKNDTMNWKIENC